ncbi:SARP family transcriptional regulator [Catellatospora sp. IY07-71]|uniref:AfsR/SARP family transcriptional regulator n=1 Tax=Catellatospora sp. IY07-71 TaxID=2728827 RepID=UPI001BB357EA|nr:BTAD domain-containing putative transcriptional regulator [Catellatospora sp. IY07-71]BCJ72457.1 SARP family transcriptional regulator [Catellatospora sp. IY07-71]
MQFRVLGPFRVESGDAPVPLGRRRERCLLALLLLEPGRAIPMDRLIDLLWDGEPPAKARRAVQAHVARLRAQLAAYPDAPVLRTEGTGYAVSVGDDRVDAHRFRSLVAQAVHRSTPVARRGPLLEEALGLWRGPVLADVAGARVRERVGQELEELRLVALESWLQAELELGRHRERMPELARAAAEHPERERFTALHMLALHRSGQTAGASAAYARYRSRLIAGTGIEPSSELRALHTSVLREDPLLSVPAPRADAAVVGARDLPAPIPDFVPRPGEQAGLDELLDAPPGARLAVVHGVGGAGKSTLVVRWAHLRAEHFPGGTYHADLGRDGARPAADLRELTGRALLILDNAADADTVRAALPADPEVTVLVVSRVALESLAVHERARLLRVAGLTPEQALELLGTVGRLAGAERGTRLARIADLCDRLPLALRIVGCRLAADPQHGIDLVLQDLVPEDRRLTALEIDGGDAGIRAILDQSYRDLAPAPAELLRLLAVHPGRVISVASAAALCDRSPGETYSLLTSLARSNLVVRDGTDYRLHDLVRLHALERAAAEDPPQARTDAVRRVADWYLDTAYTAYPLLSPRAAGPLPVEVRTPRFPLRFTSRAQATAWFETERAGLAAAVRALAAAGLHRQAWQLATALFAYYHRRRIWAEWHEVYQTALASARADGHLLGLAKILNGLGVASKQLGRRGEAIAYYQEGLAVARQHGDPLTIGPLLINLGGVYNGADEPELAREHLTAALHLAGYGDDPRYATLLRLNLGHLDYNDHRFEEAAGHMRRGLEMAGYSGDTHTMVYLNHGLGEVELQLGRTTAAARHARVALELAQALADPLRQAYALDLLASATAATDWAAAQALWEQAAQLCDGLGHALGPDIRTVLAEGPGSCPDSLREQLAKRRFAVNRLP